MATPARHTRCRHTADAIRRYQAGPAQLQQIISGLPEAIIIINPGQTIAWSNNAALKMHGVRSLEELGSNVSEYRERFELRYRNRHELPPEDYPNDRVVAGEVFSEVVVELAALVTTKPGRSRSAAWRSRTRKGGPTASFSIMQDDTERFSAEERFEHTFKASPAPASIARLSDMH